MQCIKPIRIFKNISRIEYPDGLEVPCGKCIACRIKKRKEWSIRMLHELESHENAIFITLTYDEDHLPPFSSLEKKELQKFFKRLRKKLSYQKRRIRHYSCGEYGDQTQRPHYHSIIFGMSLSISDKLLIDESWTNGLIHYGLAEPDSMRYVAQYIDKKFTGELADTEYKQKNREPVFRLLSLGLGKNYVDKNADQITQNMFITVNGVKQSLPRYYINRLGLESQKDQAYIKECDLVSHYSGFDYSRDEAYRILSPDEVRRIEDGIRDAKLQHGKNLEAKIGLKKSKI